MITCFYNKHVIIKLLPVGHCTVTELNTFFEDAVYAFYYNKGFYYLLDIIKFATIVSSILSTNSKKAVDKLLKYTLQFYI